MIRIFNPKSLKWTAYILLFLALYLLQFTPGLFPQIAGIRPVFLVQAVVMIAMLDGDLNGAVTGIVAGLLWDFGSNRIIGFNAILLMLIGCVCGLLITYLMRINLITALILCGSAIFLVELCDWFFYYVIWGYENSIFVFFRYYFPTMIFSALLIPCYFYGIRKILSRLINTT